MTIRGRVQGVFYRSWTVETARQLGLVGWVCNRLNGDVEALVQGERHAVEQFLDLARQGPPAARVETIEVDTVDAADLAGFEQHATV